MRLLVRITYANKQGTREPFLSQRERRSNQILHVWSHMIVVQVFLCMILRSI